MTLSVYTARIGVDDCDALDITRKSASGNAVAFAPSWEILGSALTLRSASRSLSAAANLVRQHGADDRVNIGEDMAVRVWDAAWSLYVVAYTGEMRASFRRNRDTWARLLARDRVVLCCYCHDHSRCHRTILGRDILPRLGARFCGEVSVRVKKEG